MPLFSQPDGSPKANAPVFGESGLAEIPGNGFIVSLGNRFSDLTREPGIFDVGSTFMHELGHNLGLRHGGGVWPQGDDINAKPNYLSVMNYRYQFTGIYSAAVVGSTAPVSRRLDYSTQTLPTGGNTPGYLDQSSVQGQPAAGDPGLGLNEPAGLGSGTADIFTFTDARVTGIPRGAATEGPVDWSGNGDFQEFDVQADTICGPSGLAITCAPCRAIRSLAGHTDWDSAGRNDFTFQFQCTPYGGSNGDGASSFQRTLQHEMSTAMAMEADAALPIKPAADSPP